ncbi:hypothetical protein GEU84_019825 [Fertoebacter nigrum]|uniref:Uncharacterized protein n=1 Tax=Fertoeibacter niger TaxID=2656921 RepID=A0A8X8GYJ9_9RHOB|nr:hypothetical protein [Fertoeibacter niger]NUB46644.1 hypothetical protein [Fertoeibacter niger]
MELIIGKIYQNLIQVWKIFPKILSISGENSEVALAFPPPSRHCAFAVIPLNHMA